MCDHAAGQITGSAGGQIHQAACRPDRTAIANEGIQRAFGHAQLGRATQVQRDLAAGAQQHLAAVCAQHTFIDDARRKKRNRATLAIGAFTVRNDLPMVDDSGTRPLGFELVTPRHEIGGTDRQGTGHDTGRVNLGTGCKQDAVRIDQKHLAIGLQRPLDHRYIRPQYPIECHRLGTGLHELHTVASSDRETLPVKRHPGAVLGHRHAVAVLANVAAATGDGPCGRQSLRGDRGAKRR